MPVSVIVRRVISRSVDFQTFVPGKAGERVSQGSKPLPIYAVF